MSGENAIQTNEVDEEDWATAWKKYYHPVKISGRFTIVPTWEEYEPVESDELIIELRSWHGIWNGNTSYNGYVFTSA